MRSRLVARAGVGHGEAGDGPTLTLGTVSHRLSPAAIELFDELDGRALGEIHPELVDDFFTRREVFELLRRLRALELVEDAP